VESLVTRSLEDLLYERWGQVAVPVLVPLLDWLLEVRGQFKDDLDLFLIFAVVGLRTLGHPDVWLPTDVGVRNALAGHPDPDPEAWAPWRSYALLHLWTSLSTPAPRPGE